MNRGYQYEFSVNRPYVFDVAGRERKACTMVAVLGDYLSSPLGNYDLLNVGGSTGIIDNFLAEHFNRVVGVDIDEHAIHHARESYRKDNLRFEVADAMNLPFKDNSFDIVVCSHVYEHVPDPHVMFDEIYRVLKPGGVCYFSAGNRLAWNEPHYNLPLLSVLPRPLAHLYIRLSGKASYYHEKHLSYWGLKSLVKRFACTDYTTRLVTESERYATDYMIRPGSLKARLAGIFLKAAHWASPGYIWVLEK
jgi:ubiquinone/menaquinone biosynthesis C-methylase UbiE